MSRLGRCHVTGADCRATDERDPVAECFACGNPVCVAPSCSRRRNWYKYKRVRVCQRCLNDAARLASPRGRRAHA